MKVVENIEGRVVLRHRRYTLLIFIGLMLLNLIVMIAMLPRIENSFIIAIFLGLIILILFSTKVNFQMEIDFSDHSILIKRFALLEFINSSYTLQFSDLRTFDITQTGKWWGIKIGFLRDQFKFTMRDPTQELLSKIQQLEQYLNRPIAALAQDTKIPSMSEIQPSASTVEGNFPDPGKPSTELIHDQMLKQIKSWRNTQIGLGVIHLIGGGFLNSPWGVVLILIGLASWVFPAPAMFVLYAVTLIWVGVRNLLGGTGGWILFSFYQMYIGIKVFGQFKVYHQNTAEAMSHFAETNDPDLPKYLRASKVFPWLGLALGGVGTVAYVGIVIMFFIMLFSGITEFPVALDFALSVAESIAILGLTLGLASLLSKFKYKAISIFAMLAGSVVILIRIYFAIMNYIA